MRRAEKMNRYRSAQNIYIFSFCIYIIVEEGERANKQTGDSLLITNSQFQVFE